MTPDFMLYDSQNQLVLVVEVKAAKNADAKWAAKLRRNLAVHGALPQSKFFLLVLPEHVYLWKDAGAFQEADPNFIADTKPLLGPYLSKFGGDTLRLSESGLELAVKSWLNDITNQTFRNGFSAEAKMLLDDSGLARSIRQGSLVYGDV